MVRVEKVDVEAKMLGEEAGAGSEFPFCCMHPSPKLRHFPPIIISIRISIGIIIIIVVDIAVV
eukprot:3429054-Pyramimonas_sp.AAC.1